MLRGPRKSSARTDSGISAMDCHRMVRHLRQGPIDAPVDRGSRRDVSQAGVLVAQLARLGGGSGMTSLVESQDHRARRAGTVRHLQIAPRRSRVEGGPHGET